MRLVKAEERGPGPQHRYKASEEDHFPSMFEEEVLAKL